MEWHDNAMFLVAAAVNLVTLGAMWGNLRSRVYDTSKEVSDLSKSIHNGITSRQIALETDMASMMKKVDRLGNLPERVGKIEARCEEIQKAKGNSGCV